MKIWVIAAPMLLAASVLSGCAKNASAEEKGKAPAAGEPARPAGAHRMNKPANMEEMTRRMEAMNKNLVAMLGDKDAKFDERFIDLMIPHHEGGILLAKQAAEKATHPELKKKAEEMIAAQQKEIDQMKQWRKEWYGKEVGSAK